MHNDTDKDGKITRDKFNRPLEPSAQIERNIDA